jgi:REP element-mobilizing transposase RayT
MMERYKERVKKPKQLEFKKVGGWGGMRRGAGRKNCTQTVNHMARERVDFKKPLMITMKLKKGLNGFRNRRMLEKFKECGRESKTFGLHVLHFSLQRDHIHIFLEAKDNLSLGSGMKSLGGRMGRALRSMLGGKGSVFKGRYHLRVLHSPTQTKNALAYVLLNQSNHEKEVPRVDLFSSAAHFGEWKSLIGRCWQTKLSRMTLDPTELPDHLSRPRSWLASEGWRRAG